MIIQKNAGTTLQRQSGTILPLETFLKLKLHIANYENVLFIL